MKTEIIETKTLFGGWTRLLSARIRLPDGTNGKIPVREIECQRQVLESAVMDCTSLDVGLFLSVDNKIRTCCAGKDLGSITENTVDEIFSSDNFLAIKNTLQQKKVPDYCKLCDKNERDAPGSSQANYFKKFSSDGTRKIKQIDLRWNNTCNLSCRYCNTKDSSSWQRLKNIPLTTVNREYYQSIFDEIEKTSITSKKYP